METFLNKIKNNQKTILKLTGIFLVIFLFLRLISFLSFNNSLLQNIFGITILIIFIYLYQKKVLYGWLFFCGEFLLGGSGHLFEINGISLRTIIFIVFITFFIPKALKLIPKKFWYGICALLVLAIYGAIMGLLFHKNITPYVIQDTIPFFFFLIALPAYYFINIYKHAHIYVSLIIAFVLGQFIQTFTTLFLFSKKLVILQEPFYKWYRDVLAGKITDLADGFFRIVTPEQILLPIILIFCLYIYQKNKEFRLFIIIFTFLIILILVPNLSRSYALAFILAILFLIEKKHFHYFLIFILGIIISFPLLFAITHIIFSQNHTPGLSKLYSRTTSVIKTDSEKSTATRKALLPYITQKIKTAPIIGNGLGSSILIPSSLLGISPSSNSFGLPIPLLSQTYIYQYDWGYLELISEFGIIATILIIYTIYRLISPWKNRKQKLLLSIIIYILALGVTTPVIFHVIGITTLSICFALIHQKSCKNTQNCVII